jgi:hypothetical protein
MHEILQRIEYIMIYLIGLVIALTLMGMPNTARSDALDYNGGPGFDDNLRDTPEPPPLRRRAPRWSNQHHYDAALATRADDCAMSPDYVAGVDAWGDPVIPADLPRRYSGWAPSAVDIDLNVGHKQIGGHHAELTAGDIYYDLANRQLNVNGAPLVKDCLPPTK